MPSGAVIVGVGPGLGLSLVKACLADGMRVVAAARSTDNLAALLPLGDVHPVACDVTDQRSVEALFAAADDIFGGPELVIFNAGAFESAPVAEIAPADFERCWRVGCMGGFLVGQQAAKRMLAAGQGSILFTGATAALRGSANFANLAVPKFGLRALAQSMARELGPQNVHVAHLVIDGPIHNERYTDLIAERGPDGLLDPDAIAQQYLMLHHQPRSAWTQELDLRSWKEKW